MGGKIKTPKIKTIGIITIKKTKSSLYLITAKTKTIISIIKEKG